VSGEEPYSVTVHRIAEGPRDDPEFVTMAVAITLHPNGNLEVKGHSGTRTFSAGLWNGIEVRRVRMPTPES
jgi:hypothetical protein